MFFRFATLSVLVILMIVIVEHIDAQGGFNQWKRRFGQRSLSEDASVPRKNLRNLRKRNRNNQKFLRKIEQRLAKGKQIFSPEAIRIIESNGWSDKYFKLPHQKLSKAFGFCDITRELDVKQMFPGLLRSEAQIRNLPEMKTTRGIFRNPVVHRNWTAKSAISIEVPEEVERNPSPRENRGLIGVRQNNGSVNSSVPVGSTSTRINPFMGFICQCCKVRRYFRAFENITIDSVEYQVFDFEGDRQFFAVEECPVQDQCQFGGCIQRTTTHSILIWNSSLPYYPSLGFAQLEIPTHCEWANIGRG